MVNQFILVSDVVQCTSLDGALMNRAILLRIDVCLLFYIYDLV